MAEQWLLDLVAAFGPKVVPIGVTPGGTYEESTTHWGMNPVYEAVPREIRDQYEREAVLAPTRDYWETLRQADDR